MPVTPAPISLPSAEQEVRFAIVMYGGVSLAVYIHGVAQELLRLVRSTSGADISADRVAQIYRVLSRDVRAVPGAPAAQIPAAAASVPLATAGSPAADRRQTRFVVDILSGTSAGGINAVFLAKALANRSQTLDDLRKTWVESADMENLLKKTSRFDRQKSLLDGQWMYGLLYDAFRTIDRGEEDNAAHQVEQLDLFVTTTDLNGVETPIALANQHVPERVHKGSFHFRHESLEVQDENRQATLRRTDFDSQFDAMLAFAARCTSSFPVAFAPMKLDNIADIVGEQYSTLRAKYQSFFSWVRDNRLYGESDGPVTTAGTGKSLTPYWRRELADGGYLDNKPFGHVIEALSYRPTTVAFARKLVYVDPFPENPATRVEKDHFTFAENGLAAAYDLPRYETIREDINRIKEGNRKQERLRYLTDMFDSTTQKAFRGNTDEIGQRILDKTAFGDLKLSELVKLYGPGYATYHGIRVYGVTDDIAHIIASLGGSLDDDDLYLALRFLIRHWRILNYDQDGVGKRPDGEPKDLETKFLTDFDFSFRLRRLAGVLAWAHAKPDYALAKELVEQQVRINRRRELLCRADETNPLARAIGELAKYVRWSDLQEILKPATETERLNKASEIYDRLVEAFGRYEQRYPVSRERSPKDVRANNKSPLDDLVDTLRTQWISVFKYNRDKIQGLFEKQSEQPDPLKDQWEAYDLHDLMSMTFLEGSDVREHTDTEIFRISPAGGIDRPPENKLAGYSLAAFGAFLERSWRENDILWGRLDASQQLVEAILPHHEDQELRDHYIAQLRIAIIEQEKTSPREDDWTGKMLVQIAQKNTDLLTKNREMEFALKEKYELPAPPKPGQSTRQAALATDILGRMIEEDIGSKSSPSSTMQFAGGLIVGLVGLLTPGTLGRAFLNYWLSLLLVLSILVFSAGTLGSGFSANNDDLHRLTTLGRYGIGFTLSLMVATFGIGRFLKGHFWPIKAIAGLLALFLIMVLSLGIRQVEMFGPSVERLWYGHVGTLGNINFEQVVVPTWAFVVFLGAVGGFAAWVVHDIFAVMRRKIKQKRLERLTRAGEDGDSMRTTSPKAATTR